MHIILSIYIESYFIVVCCTAVLPAHQLLNQLNQLNLLGVLSIRFKICLGRYTSSIEVLQRQLFSVIKYDGIGVFVFRKRRHVSLQFCLKSGYRTLVLSLLPRFCLELKGDL